MEILSYQTLPWDDILLCIRIYILSNLSFSRIVSFSFGWSVPLICCLKSCRRFTMLLSNYCHKLGLIINAYIEFKYMKYDVHKYDAPLCEKKTTQDLLLCCILMTEVIICSLEVTSKVSQRKELFYIWCNLSTIYSRYLSKAIF